MDKGHLGLRFPSPLLVVIAGVVLAGGLFGQTNADEANSCELVNQPERFNGKIVTVRGRALIAFEDLRLDTALCGGGKKDVA